MIAPGLDRINIVLPNVTSDYVPIEATVNGVFSLPKDKLLVPFPLVSTVDGPAPKATSPRRYLEGLPNLLWLRGGPSASAMQKGTGNSSASKSKQ